MSTRPLSGTITGIVFFDASASAGTETNTNNSQSRCIIIDTLRKNRSDRRQSSHGILLEVKLTCYYRLHFLKNGMCSRHHPQKKKRLSGFHSFGPSRAAASRVVNHHKCRPYLRSVLLNMTAPHNFPGLFQVPSHTKSLGLNDVRLPQIIACLGSSIMGVNVGSDGGNAGTCGTWVRCYLRLPI